MDLAAGPSKYRRMRLVQSESEWRIDDLPWDALDASRPLLPACEALASELGLDAAEHLAVSQLLGLMAVQAISEHEKILGMVQDECWRQPLQRLGASADLLELGEQFFKEEGKHSAAFARYVETFAKAAAIDIKDLRAILPQYARDSWMTRLFRLNRRLGGRAIWWLVLITEEESVALFRQIRSSSATIDPLFHELNRRHFEEEVRHSAYAPLMLRTLPAKRTDYMTAEALHVAWVLSQMMRVRRVKALRGNDAFSTALRSAFAKLDALPLRRKVDVLLSHTPYVSDLLRPSRHKAVRIEWQRSDERAPGLAERCLTWIRARVTMETAA